MPVTYQIDAHNKTIRTKCCGQVTVAEIVNHFQTLQQDTQCPQRLAVFLDLSEMSSIPETRQLAAVVTEMKKIRAKVRFEACAILTSRDALYGMMRVFEMLAEELFEVTCTFRVATKAEAWLVSQQLLIQVKTTDGT